MLSREIANLERENRVLKDALEELRAKMEENGAAKPKSCQYCKNYVQHYRKGMPGDREAYVPVNDGYCLSEVPVCKGGKRRPKPDDTCQFFELGTPGTRRL